MGKKLQLLGTGGSTGVPVLGCKCQVCSSTDPMNKRLRTQGVIKLQNKNILIDAGPDIRQQCLQFGIDHVDAIFITHYHEDHIGGFDDLRGFFFNRNKKPIPVYLSKNTYEMIAVRFGYLLERFEFIQIEDNKGEISLFNETFKYFSYKQGSVPVLGYLFENIAYLTDIRNYDDEIFSFLKGVDSLVISALNFSGSHMHLSINEAVNFGQKAKIKNIYLVHMNHEIEYQSVTKDLPKGAYLATDGMEIDVRY